MAKSNTVTRTVTNNKENNVNTATETVVRTPDITRPNTKAFALAKMLSDGRRKGKGATRKEIKDKLGFDPAPYIVLYDCFEAVERGRYIYTGKALKELVAA